jgi:hypothetical protein
MVETLNEWAQLALTVCGIAAAIVAAVQGTRWGQSKAVQVARDTLEVLEAVATAAVRATEQEYRKAPDPRSETEAQTLRQEKAERALGRFYQLLPPGYAAEPAEAKAMIERALHDVNAEKSRVDPQ